MKFRVVRFQPRTRPFASPAPVLFGIGAGLAAMYLLDPVRGRGRRTQLEQRSAKGLRHGRALLAKASRDLANRAAGVVAVATIRSRGEVPDEVLVERVRSAIGRVLSHPKAVSVTSQMGVVTLSGHVLAHEADALLATANRVRGVMEVNSALEIHEEPSHAPSHRGRGRMVGAGLLARIGAPGPRLLLIASGLLLGVAGLIKRGFGGYLAAGGGALLLTSAGLPGRARARHRSIEAQQSITVNAPVSQVFGMWCDFERFPEFMSSVKQISRVGENRYHWIVTGPAGAPIEWDSEVTRLVPNKVIAWNGIGTAVSTSGLVHFAEVSAWQTRIDIFSQWQPAAGVAGRMVAMVFGKEPAQMLRDDLIRFKERAERSLPRFRLSQPSHP